MGAASAAGVVTPDIENLLVGLAGAARAERAELIEWLLEQGITVEEIRGAGMPLLLAAGREVGDDGRQVSTRAVAEAHGIDVELLQRVQRALGLARVDDPDAAVHMRADAEAAAHVKHFAALGLDPDDLVTVARVIADGLSQAAQVMRHTAMAAVLEPGASELRIAQRYQALVREIAPLLGPWIEDMLFMQLRHMMETEAVNASERAAGAPLPGARHVTVAFADLVGFTRLGEAVPPEELERLASRLAEQARDVAVPPVRFVKTIGDAAMLISPDPAPLVTAVLRLIESTDAESDFPQLRAGVAAGKAVGRAGDWFGSPVNTASRVTGVARPGAVLVTESVNQALADNGGFSWSFAGARHLKGIKGETKLFRARRAEVNQ